MKRLILIVILLSGTAFAEELPDLSDAVKNHIELSYLNAGAAGVDKVAYDYIAENPEINEQIWGYANWRKNTPLPQETWDNIEEIKQSIWVKAISLSE